MSSLVDLEKFKEDGYFVVENFLDDDSVESLRTECAELVDKMDPKEHHTVFSTVKKDYRDDYFINSADKIGYFFEDGALNDEGDLQVSKDRSLNKIGHTLHVDCPNFKKVTFCKNVKQIAADVGLKDPVVTQSMYIFKQPNIGGKVVPHQDCSFLYVDPVDAVVGMWIALEDATLENGCLWFIPGSHKAGVLGNYRMVRNPDTKGSSCIFIGENPKYNDEDFVAVPVKKGSLILIHGLVVHKSERNLSEKSRHIYTFHMFDKAGSTWSEQNWLQPTKRNTFTHVNEVQL